MPEYSLEDYVLPVEYASKPLPLGLNFQPAPELPLEAAFVGPSPYAPVAYAPPTREQRLNTLRQKLRKWMPWLISAGILTVDIAIHAPMFVIGAAAFGLSMAILRAIVRKTPALQRAIARLMLRLGVKQEWLNVMSAGVAGGILTTVSSPSNALFFQAAEQYVTTLMNIGGGANGAAQFVPLIFGTLRVIFILYIGIALVRCINAFRNDEDWTTAARIPLIVVLCVVIGDALSALIVQGG